MAGKATRNKVNNELLVEMIRQYPFLYDTANVKYKNKQLKENRLQAIAAELKVPLEVVQTRWRTLRDRFRKEMIYYCQQKRNGAGSYEVQPPKWPLYSILAEFLGKTMEFRELISHIKAEPIEANNSSDSEVPDPENEIQTPVLESEIEHNSEIERNSEMFQTLEVVRVVPSTFSEDSSSSTLTGLIRQRNKRTEEPTSKKLLSILSKTTENMSAAHKINMLNLHRLKGNENVQDEAFFYSQSLINRFRALPLQSFHFARVKIESLLFKLEHESIDLTNIEI